MQKVGTSPGEHDGSAGWLQLVFIVMVFIVSCVSLRAQGGGIHLESKEGWKARSHPSMLPDKFTGYGSLLIVPNRRIPSSMLFILQKDTLEGQPCDDVALNLSNCDDPTVSVEEEMVRSLKMLSLSLLPNPSTTEVILQIYSPLDAVADITITDLQGNIVFFQNKQKLTTPVTKLTWNCMDMSGTAAPSGQYIVEVRSDVFSDTKILTIVH